MITEALQIYISTEKVYEHNDVVENYKSVRFEILCDEDTDVDTLELDYYFMYDDGYEMGFDYYLSIHDFVPCDDGTMIGSVSSYFPSGTGHIVAYLIKDNKPIDSAVKYVKGDYPNGEY